ncbi:hypothetical protein EDB19DRAFT_192309 [Suillus lakei]|nr:hypothetical protein EDB19DRAFT_192309 [Suillus lakei]
MYNETTSSPNYTPGTSRASTAWWSGPDVNGLDQRFSGDLTFLQNSGHQHHVTDHTAHTAFGSIPENSLLSHSETADNTTFCYSENPWYPPPEDNNLTRAYIQSHRHPLWWNPGNIPPSLQAMTLQSSMEQLPIIMPPQAQPTLHECDWTENGERCCQPILDDRRKLGIHLRDFHNVQGNDKKDVVCLWQGCNRKMQRGAIGRHIISCHLKTKWTCKNCFKEYSRKDAMKKHTRECQAT